LREETAAARDHLSAVEQRDWRRGEEREQALIS
jgi:hypothetical protein